MTDTAPQAQPGSDPAAALAADATLNAEAGQAPAKVSIPGVGEVSTDEIVEAFSKSKDYTKKTQELAANQKLVDSSVRFAQDFRANPQAIIRQQAGLYGLEVVDPSQKPDPVQSILADEDWDDDRAKQALAAMAAQNKAQTQALEQRLHQAEQKRQAEAAWHAGMAEVQKLDPEADPREILEYAHQAQIPNAKLAWQAMRGDPEKSPPQKKAAAQTLSPEQRDALAKVKGPGVDSSAAADVVDAVKPSGNTYLPLGQNQNQFKGQYLAAAQRAMDKAGPPPGARFGPDAKK